MPSSRQFRVIGLIVLLTVLVLYYVSNGARLTHESEFYKKTVAAIEHKKDAVARQHIIEEEQQRLQRVERLQKEHDAAMSSVSTGIISKATDAADNASGAQKQKPIVEDSRVGEGEKSVAGRKKMKDGKVVEGKAGDSADGVAKVGNVEAKGTSVATAGGEEDSHSDEEHQIELELNNILKKGPIIVFSKSYCPFSKKAKHILLDLYDISPPPYVVELDHHELGPGLQSALQKSTGRRTVPNVLINGKSIGGGDDIQALHDSSKIIETVRAMGGKRIMSISAKSEHEQRAQVKFKA